MSEHEHKHEVKIFIDQQSHHSPNPTTGAALYALGQCKAGHGAVSRSDRRPGRPGSGRTGRRPSI